MVVLDCECCEAQLTLSCCDTYVHVSQMKSVAQGFGSEPPLIDEEAPDIVDEAAYSIQEDKLKTEDDNRCPLPGASGLGLAVHFIACAEWLWVHGRRLRTWDDLLPRLIKPLAQQLVFM